MRAKKHWPAARRETLYQGLAALDRSDQAKALVDQEGLSTCTATTGVIHIHPATKLEREFRGQAVKMLDSLGLLSLTGSQLLDDLT